MDPGASTDSGSPASLSFIHTFVTLQVIAGVGFTVVLCTALFSRNVKRSPIWISFCASWAFSCFSYTLLFVAGQHIGKEPDRALCTTQAALVYANPSLTVLNTLALVIHMWSTVRFVVSKKPLATGLITTTILLAAPYLVFLVMLVGLLVFGIQNPDAVQRNLNGTYCNMIPSTPSKLVDLILLLATTSMVSIEVIVGMTVYRNWTVFAGNGNTFRMVVRVMAFTIFTLLGIVVLGMSVGSVLTSDSGTLYELTIATVPFLGVFIFGSQTDLIRVWMFWKPRYTENRPLSPAESFDEKFTSNV